MARKETHMYYYVNGLEEDMEKRQWDRKAIKKRGKERFFANYWSSVLVALVILAITGGFAYTIRPFTIGNPANTIINMRQQSEITDYFRDGCDTDTYIESDGHGLSISDGDEHVSISADGDGLNIKAEDGSYSVDISAGEDGIHVDGGSTRAGVSGSGIGRYDSDGTAAGIAVSWATAGMAVAVILSVFMIIFLICLALQVFVINPLKVGGVKFFINNLEKKESPKQLGAMFRSGQYGRTVLTMFLKGLFTFLWTLLFIVPGMIKAYEYRMIPYLIADRPEMTRKEMFDKSREMMYGYKWKAFVFDLSYIGWGILNILTFNILGIFYVFPYKHQADAALYEFLCNKEKTEEHYENYIEVQ